MDRGDPSPPGLTVPRKSLRLELPGSAGGGAIEMTHLLGKRVLIVEDDSILAINLAEELAAEQVKVVGPAVTVTEALDVIARTDLDGAIVDINLRGKAAFPVADALADRHIPFVFATGYLVAGHIPARHSKVRRFEKPTAPGIICRALEEAMTEASDQGANNK